MKTIQLTYGFVAFVDDEDFARFGHLKWMASKKKKGTYAVRESGGKSLYLARTILGVTDPRVKVDHRNHDTLDCQRRNLRSCTNAQNIQNRKGPNSNSKSRRRGVSRRSDCNRWAAYICIHGKTKYLGLFKTAASAAVAYAAANRKHFGEFGGRF